MFHKDGFLEAARTSIRLPFSLMIGQRPADFRFKRERPARNGIPGGTLIFEEEQSPLTVLFEWEDIPEGPMLRFQWRLLARGDVEEPLHDFYFADLQVADSKTATLHGWNGGNVYRDGRNAAFGVFPPHEFREWEHPLSEKPITLEERHGKSSSTYLPLWIVEEAGKGFWIGPEWSGSWNMVADTDSGGLHFRIGLPCLHFQVRQAEEIPFPPVCLGTFSGDFRDGCVALRRAIREAIMPDIGGRTPVPPAEQNVIGGSRPELDREGLAREIALADSLGLENFVWAAAWYRPPTGLRSFLTDEEIAELFPGFPDRAAYELMSFWESSGPCVARDESRFGGDLLGFSRHLRERGMRHGLWYDPRFGYKLPEYEEKWDALIPPAFNKPQDKGYAEGHINMACREGRALMEETLNRLVEDYGAAYIWHDLNCSPRPEYWNSYESPNRRGLTELLHYNGSNEVYDRFLEKHPDVWIMWCGGGGSMIDLGVLRRCHSLFIADNNDYSASGSENANCDINRAYRTALNWILPSSYITNMLGAAGAYDYRENIGTRDLLSLFGGCFTLHGLLARLKPADLAEIAHLVGVFKGVRHFFTKDFWSLFPQAEDREGWDGWQFHDPETRSGVLLLFKRRDCVKDKQSVRLKWLENAEPLFGNIVGEADIRRRDDVFEISLPGDCALLRYDCEARTDKDSFTELMTQ